MSVRKISMVVLRRAQTLIPATPAPAAQAIA